MLVLFTLALQGYLFQPGYLSDGNDLGELFFDVSDAKKYCDAEKTCQGFTFKETEEPTQKLSVRFKSNSAVTYDPSWLSYTKSGPAPYFYSTGFLGDGKELHAASMTLADAQTWCDKNVKCKGFSADKPRISSDTVYCRFSDMAKVTYEGNFMTYTKVRY
ncbi:hypothetical protein T492DRAFT_866506 [Pavlovales sp. CCMP2436]|nr:hypothetical protein T492DRAFT_866506 [Pavlovales sp. CCMP2436]